ncbi:hypothetical protein [Fibrobacter sp. UWB13]|uniref:hypothetical protein n=1 Tax=Fibrobacter sp. UWB13 TaxID=1896204 RepID=UPI000A0E9B33|nr:hypothetical protein [Fibrobacter sp. UWB13]SMG24387.1 hypothetical protein SAMN05720489_1700 [Fibrobacter sp. UWB13]
MKTLKFITAVMLAFMVTTSFAARIVKSKLGDIEVTNAKDGGKVFCTAEFNDELTIVKEAETKVLVKGRCGMGWVDKSKVEYVAKAQDKVIIFDEIPLLDWHDNPMVTGILIDDIEDFDIAQIDRDFKEYLTYTMDREQTEIRNGEN